MLEEIRVLPISPPDHFIGNVYRLPAIGGISESHQAFFDHTQWDIESIAFTAYGDGFDFAVGYVADWEIPPLLWTILSPPFSPQRIWCRHQWYRCQNNYSKHPFQDKEANSTPLLKTTTGMQHPSELAVVVSFRDDAM